jgi:peptide subunit release factor 1 (eRF1)
VQQLYMSTRFVRDHADAAEFAVRSALEQGASVETVSGAASTKLDALGGIAARLRFAIRPTAATAAGVVT